MNKKFIMPLPTVVTASPPSLNIAEDALSLDSAAGPNAASDIIPAAVSSNGAEFTAY